MRFFGIIIGKVRVILYVYILFIYDKVEMLCVFD